MEKLKQQSHRQILISMKVIDLEWYKRNERRQEKEKKNKLYKKKFC